MSPDTVIYAAAIVPTAAAVVIGIAIGVIADHRVARRDVAHKQENRAVTGDGPALPASAVIRHPSHARTRQHFAKQPLPRQRSAR